MNLESLQLHPQTNDEILAKDLTEIDGKICVNGWLALRLCALGKQAQRMLYRTTSVGNMVDTDAFDENGTRIGTFVPMSQVTYNSVDELPDERLACYLSEVKLDEYPTKIVHKYDYFVTMGTQLNQFRENFSGSSAVWGGFVIDEESHTPQVPDQPESLVAWKNASLAESPYDERAKLYAFSGDATDAFLKLYHLIELSFDLALINELKSLSTDLTGIARLKKMLGKSELDCLIYLTSKAGISASEFWQKAVSGSDFEYPALQTILVDYEKTVPRNTDMRKFVDDLMNRRDYDSLTCLKGESRSVITELILYTLYRLRCCVAHARIGEHVLQSSEIPILENFGIPLLQFLLQKGVGA